MLLRFMPPPSLSSRAWPFEGKRWEQESQGCLPSSRSLDLMRQSVVFRWLDVRRFRQHGEKLFPTAPFGALGNNALGLPGAERLRQRQGHQPLDGHVFLLRHFDSLFVNRVRHFGFDLRHTIWSSNAAEILPG